MATITFGETRDADPEPDDAALEASVQGRLRRSALVLFSIETGQRHAACVRDLERQMRAEAMSLLSRLAADEFEREMLLVYYMRATNGEFPNAAQTNDPILDSAEPFAKHTATAKHQKR
jgi:hypothetical protein